jgi:hypothetical protein
VLLQIIFLIYPYFDIGVNALKGQYYYCPTYCTHVQYSTVCTIHFSSTQLTYDLLGIYWQLRNGNIKMAIAAPFKLGWKMCGIVAYNRHFIILRDCTIQYKALGDLTFEYSSYCHFLNNRRATDQIAKCWSVSWVLLVYDAEWLTPSL